MCFAATLSGGTTNFNKFEGRLAIVYKINFLQEIIIIVVWDACLMEIRSEVFVLLGF